MKIELVDYCIENEGTSKATAFLTISADGVEIPAHIVLNEFSYSIQDGWADVHFGIGCPSDERDVSLSVLSPEARLLLLGVNPEADEVEEHIIEFETLASRTLTEQIGRIASKMDLVEALTREQEVRRETPWLC